VSPLLQPPRSGVLAGLPDYQLDPTDSLYRIHRFRRDPWWFSSDLAGRFDLAPPNGTCYLAAEPIGAFVEVFRDVSRGVPQRLGLQRRLSVLTVPRPMRLADCTARAARGFGLTAAIHSTPDYALTQEWAQAFHQAGFDGVRYFLSHDPAQTCVGIALFGPAGLADAAWRRPRARSIPLDLIDQAWTELGITVVPTP